MAWVDRRVVVSLAALCSMIASACADDGGSGAETGGSDSGGSGSGGSGSVASSSGGSDSDELDGTMSESGAESGMPPGEPTLQPGACGWAGEQYACGYADVGGVACPATAAAGMPCESGVDPLTCCLDPDMRLTCQCAGGNACDFIWVAEPCATGQGAGACGWSGEAYTCGGQGEDPGGASSECPPDDPLAECTPGATCCDPSGDARVCICENVCNWVTTDCVLDG